jgi:phage tail protein X
MNAMSKREKIGLPDWMRSARWRIQLISLQELMRQRTGPTLDDLKQMPLGHLRGEIAQLCADAGLADNAEVLAEAEMLAMDPDPEPERIVELWSRLRGEVK